ncbi:putative pentatricopeptide repeat-containing protein [Iris pallida]|uniref:Pentatricopeptide repeat-containing protein n=1 Tax=Iris pallida TaxID=29817 RepID=A0AAX6E604_IRIPA|nr:putative pentatricopeptide repeat-containing protein [Iris pallida]
MLNVFPRPRPLSSLLLHDPSAIDHFLRHCSSPRQAGQIHAVLLHLHPASAFLAAGLVSLYSRLRLLPLALSAFLSFPHRARTPLLCNSVLRAHLRSPSALLSLHSRLPFPLADAFTFPLLLKASSLLSDPLLSSSLHARAVLAGLHSHLHVANELISVYSNHNKIHVARQVFDRMPVRNIISYNALLSGFAADRDYRSADDLFRRRMGPAGMAPNPVTWTSLLSVHARCQRHREVVDLFDEMRAGGTESTAEAAAVALSVCAYVDGVGLGKGMKIHGYVVRVGFGGYLFVRNSLICMYGKLGNREDAEGLFEDGGARDLVSWNALISSYAAGGHCEEAYAVFSQMERSGEVEPNVVTWSAVIGGFATAGLAESSLCIFRRMQQADVQPNAVTLATVLSSCGELSALESGKEIHTYTMRSLMDRNILVRNGLLNMYTKSGSLRKALLVFNRMSEKDLISWNTMITGFGMHGFCSEALDTFDNMVQAGFKPDGITFVAALSACSHAGNVEVGRRLLDQMVHEYKLTPAMEHYSCMVDLLGRAGLLKEATALVEGMQMRPNACVWGALLNACRLHGNVVLAEDCATSILGLEGEITGNYMLLSNIYAASGKWQESAKMRVMAKARGLKKQLSQSWIELRKKVFAFSAGSSLPHQTEEVYEVLGYLSRHLDSKNIEQELDFVGYFHTSKPSKRC